MINEKLTIRISKNNGTEYAETTLPATSKVFEKIFKELNIDGKGWSESCETETCLYFCRAIETCKSLSELNYLGFLYSKLSDFQKMSFFRFAQYDWFEGRSIDVFINMMLLFVNKTLKYPLGYYDKRKGYIPADIQVKE